MSASSEVAAGAPEPGPDLSIEAEREVARRFMGRIQWEAIAVGLGQCLAWFANWGLVLAGSIPLWLGFVVATVCAGLAYLPSHEGQHGNLSGRRKRWKWLDGVVGQISLIPLAQSQGVLRVTHLKHHAHTNDPELDVDYHTKGPRWWHAALGVHRGYASGQQDVLAAHMERDPAFAAGLAKGTPVFKALRLIRIAMVVIWPLETLLLWWLPEKIAVSYLGVYFSWYPHHPMEDTGRYRDTRFWRIRLPRYLDQSMQPHVIHHMYPGVPHWDEPKAMEALRPFIVARGVRGAADIPEKVRFNPLMSRVRPHPDLEEP